MNDAVLSTVCAVQAMVAALKVTCDETLRLQQRELHEGRRILRTLREIVTMVSTDPGSVDAQIQRLKELGAEVDKMLPQGPEQK